MKRTITIVAIIIVVIAAVWFVFDNRSQYPMSLEDIMNSTASSTVSNEMLQASVGANPVTGPESQIVNNKPVKNFMHTITIETNKGTIVFETYDRDAPKTVENFVTLSDKKFYDNVIFHRIIKDFMIQGGDPTGTGTGGPGYKFADELNPETPSYKTGYVRGTVAMANSGPNTNGSQFFIMHKDNPLPHSYTIFGKVVSGMDVVDAIASTKTDSKDKPIDDIVIKEVTVVEK